MRLTLIIVGLDQAVTFFFMAGAAIGPFHRYDVNNVIGVLFQVASTLAMVYFVRAGHGLVAMALITIATTIARNVVRRIYQQRLVPQIKFGIRFINKGIIRELLSYGIISFFIVVSWMIVFNTSNIIIGLFLTTTAVTYYNIAGTIVNNLRILIGAVGIPLVPAVSHYDAKGDKGMIASLYGKLTRYLFYFSGCVATGVLIFGDNFIYQWMGPDFAATVRILYILIIPLAVYLPQNMATSILLGIGKHRVLFYVLMAEAIVNLALSLALVKPLGLVGIALGMAITQIAIYTYVFPSIFFKIIGGSLGAFYRYSLKSLVTGTLFLGPVGLILDRFVPVPGWIGIIIYGLAMGILGLWGFWWKVCDPDDRQRLLSRLPLRVRPAPQKP
jgi:O-antigen/teichoic acid export membrane protein